jgi:hypothetical protein
MAYGKKIVLHCPQGLHRSIDSLVDAFIKSGVVFVGVVGKDASRIEDVIDEICVGDGSNVYEMLTASHEGETIQDAINMAEQLTGEYAGPIQVVEF